MRGFRQSVWIGLILVSGCGLLGHRSRYQPATSPADDARIAAEIEARLAAEPSIGSGRIRLEVTRGEVQLRGSVAGMGALRCAEINAELTRGVVLVLDDLVLEPGPRTVRCLAPRC